MLDCGEGSQVQLKKYGIGLQKIDHIFISHTHGDHYLGLAGLVSSMNLLGRDKKLHIYGSPNLKKVIDLHFQMANSRSAFEIEYIITQNKKEEILLDKEDIRVMSFPVKHKIPATGFLVSAGSKKRKLLKEELEKHNVPKHLRSGIKEGKDYQGEDGKKVGNEVLTTIPDPLRHYAFCADTVFYLEMVKHISGVNMMYHESSFLKGDQKKAKEVTHSTAEQAATVAKEAEAGKLLIGHFSSKYSDDEAFLKEARAIFPETFIATQGSYYEVI